MRAYMGPENVKIVISENIKKSEEDLTVHRWPVNISHPLTFPPVKIHKSGGWKQSLRDKITE
jgi:DNA polymerase III psi subunit